MRINAQGGELVLRNEHGDTIIVPRERRKEAMKALLKDDHRAIDSLALQLPKASRYAAGGTVMEGGDPKPKEITGPTTVITAKKDPDSLLENIIEWVDPTGVSSYDDVYRSFKDPDSSGLDRTLNVLSAMPFIGKLTKFTKAGIKLQQGVRHMGQIETLIKDVGSVLGSLAATHPKYEPKLKNAYLATTDFFNKPGWEAYDKFTRSLHPLRKRNSLDMESHLVKGYNQIAKGGKLGFNVMDGLNEYQKQNIENRVVKNK